MSTLIQHSSKTVEHYTPQDLLERIRTFLVRIELDPASNKFANTRVQATRFYSEYGEFLPWRAKTVFCNPPGGRGRKRKSLSTEFWVHAKREFTARHFEECAFLAFNSNTLFINQDVFEYPVLMLQKRLHFFSPSTDKEMKAPPGHSALIYLGKPQRYLEFAETFKDLGTCVTKF